MSWSTIATVLRVGIAGGVLALLGHIVTPATMGLYGIGWAGASFGYVISMTGAAQAIISLPALERAHIGAAQALSMLIALTASGLLLAIAPFATRFYGSEDVGQAVRIGALFVPLMSLGAVDIARLQNDLAFSNLAVVQTIAVTLAALVSIMLALAGQELVALFALQGLIGVFVFIVARFWIRSPGFYRFDRRHFADIWSIGIHLSLGSLTGVLWQNIPQLVLGKVAPVHVVGLYVFCSRVVQLIFAQLSGMINNVIYPTFARLRDDPAKVGATFVQTVRFTYFRLNLPLLVMAAAPLAFLNVYGGGQWAAGAVILFWLTAGQMILALGANVFPTFAAMGKPSVAWRWNLFISAVQGGAIIVVSNLGIVVIVQTLTITAAVMPLAVWWLSRIAPFRMRDYARNMAPIMGALVPAIAIGHVLEGRLALPALVELVVIGGLALSVFAGTLMVIDRNLRIAIVGLAGKLVVRRRVSTTVEPHSSSAAQSTPVFPVIAKETTTDEL